MEDFQGRSIRMSEAKAGPGPGSALSSAPGDFPSGHPRGQQCDQTAQTHTLDSSSLEPTRQARAFTKSILLFLTVFTLKE
jgi:hypothetical protein